MTNHRINEARLPARAFAREPQGKISGNGLALISALGWVARFLRDLKVRLAGKLDASWPDLSYPCRIKQLLKVEWLVHAREGSMSGSKPHEESDSPASSQTITIGSKGIAVSLRRFLADIAPGMFLLLIVYLYGEAHGQKFLDLTSEGAAYRMVFYLLIAIPAGFIVNATSYYVLGGVVRSLEGLMLRSNFICGKMVTICDWEEVKKFFKLDSDKNGSDYLIFRYNCQSVIAKRDKEWFATIDVGGVEMLSRSMAFLSAVYVALVLFYWRDPLNIAVPLGLAAAAFFLLLSAFDSLYIGVRCIRYLLVICKNDLDKKEGHSWDKVLSLLPSTADRTKT